MRVVFENGMQNKFIMEAVHKTNCKSMRQFALKLNLLPRTVQNWSVEKHHLPKIQFEKIIEIEPDLKVYEKYIKCFKNSNWGQQLGGKNCYKIIIQKYGYEEIERRQRNGLEKARKLIKSGMVRQSKPIIIDLTNEKFLEFYGLLLGDGWLSKSYNKKYDKIIWTIGVSGHSENDRQYLLEKVKPMIKEMFNRKAYVKFKKDCRGMEIIFGHKNLIKFMNEQLDFPIGIKNNLTINEDISKDWNRLKFVIRGIFDTDGSIYLDKTPVGKPYPTISISMKAPILISQIRKMLLENGFKVQLRKDKDEIKLKGYKQVNKWFNEIGSSNENHLKKYRVWLNAPVAQLG